MDQTFTIIPNTASSPAARGRVAWVDTAHVVARVLPEPKLIGPMHVCARLADLRRLARRYRDLRRVSSEASDSLEPQSPFSSSLPLAG